MQHESKGTKKSNNDAYTEGKRICTIQESKKYLLEDKVEHLEPTSVGKLLHSFHYHVCAQYWLPSQIDRMLFRRTSQHPSCEWRISSSATRAATSGAALLLLIERRLPAAESCPHVCEEPPIPSQRVTLRSRRPEAVG